MMDNFIGRIGQKRNAHDIIRANSAAEAIEMQKLQTKVSEYEKIIEEMQKVTALNIEAIKQMQLHSEGSIRKVEAQSNEVASQLQELVNGSLQRVEAKNLEMVNQLQNLIDESIQRVEMKSMDTATRLQDLADVSIQKVENKSNEATVHLQDLADVSFQKVEFKSSEVANQMQALADIGIQKLEVSGNEVTSSVQAITDATIRRVEEMKSETGDNKNEFQQLSDNMHKENVKVYRNVQAVVVDGFKEQEVKIIELEETIKKKLATTKFFTGFIWVVVSIDLGLHIARIIGIL